MFIFYFINLSYFLAILAVRVRITSIIIKDFFFACMIRFIKIMSEKSI